MTEIEQKEQELQRAIEDFAASLRQVEAHNQEKLEDRLTHECALIHKLRTLTAQGRFCRAFSKAEQEELMRQLDGLEMGRCAHRLQEICTMIEEALARQHKTDNAFLAEIRKSVPPEKYRQYEALFGSDLFLNYIVSPGNHLL